MTGYCKTLGCYFGTQQSTDSPFDGFDAIQVYRDGNVHILAHFNSEDDADDFASEEHIRQLVDHGQFGVGA
jgi:hypothetical protein